MTAAARSGARSGHDHAVRAQPAAPPEPAPLAADAYTYHGFDYNLDFFEVGALDDDRWKLPDDPARYRQRAAAARAGLWGNHGYEAANAMVYVDDHDARSPAPTATSCASPSRRRAGRSGR